MTYYCEICKAEVDGDVKSCPLCGVFFSGVMCPRCEKIGSSHDFLDGCPRCGNPGDGSFVGKAASQTAILKGNHEEKHRPWRPSLYWFLSVLIIVIVGFITSYWLRN